MQEAMRSPQMRQLMIAGAVLLILFMAMGLLRLVVNPRLGPPGASESTSRPSAISSSYVGSDPASSEEFPEEETARVSVLGIWGRLAVILLVLYGVAVGIKRLRTRASDAQWSEAGDGPLAQTAEAPDALMWLRDSINLDDAGAIHLIQVEDELLVVGCVERRMALLARLPKRRQDPAEDETAAIGEPVRAQRTGRRRAGADGTDDTEATRRRTVPEWEWAKRRGELIRALKQQVEA